MRPLGLFFAVVFFFSIQAVGQPAEKVVFDAKDSADGYYLAVRPRSNAIKGTLVLCISFSAPEWMLPETKLHNVTYANDLLTVFVSLKQKLYADTATVGRLNTVLRHIAATYAADTAAFVLAGYDFAGPSVLRYTELSHERPSPAVLQPKAVITIDSPVDLFGLWHWSQRQVKRNSRSAWDAKFIMDLMTKEHGTVRDQRKTYESLTPFYAAAAADTIGNEQYLKTVPLRLYYDVDPVWQLTQRGNSLYDTHLPEATELVSRLLVLGNKDAELVVSKLPGRNSKGVRSPNSLSIVDEVDCIHWIKNKLGIFDPNTWVAPYRLLTPAGWSEERFPIPIEFAPQIPYKGVEDVRFAPGWGEPQSEQYWSYAYLWWLEGKQRMDAPVLQGHLRAYYGGLVARNIKERSIPQDKVRPTEATLKKTATEAGDAATYEGTVRMLDYMAQQPIVLNVKVHEKECAKANRTAVFIEVSPKSFTHAVWRDLDQINNSLDCKQ